MRTTLRFGLFLALSLALLLSACQSNRVPVEATAPENAGEQPPPVAEVTTVEGEPATEAAPVVTEAPGVPEDIPVMDGAYKLQIIRSGSNVTYTVDGDIAAVFEFYQSALPGLGWNEVGAPDSAVGSIATMLRENEAGDRLTINMQENKLGGFVNLTIAVIRGQ